MSLIFPELEQLYQIARSYQEAVVELAQRICAIPASTGAEGQRAELIASLLRERGYEPEIDEISNVYVRRGKHSGRPVLMLLAHTDTVFPAGTPLKIERDGDVLRGPGIADNSVGVAAMITLLEMLDKLGYETDVDIIAVADVGEEGQGNLRGARAAVERYREKLGAVIAIDGRIGRIVNRAVGSKRWRITVVGPGGHAFYSFGSPNAIYGLGRIITEIAALEVPRGSQTTFNVNTIEGGISSNVNTIATQASAMIDMRSIDMAALDRLAEQVKRLVERSVGPGLQTRIEVLGERPASACSEDSPLVRLATQCVRWVGYEPKLTASSTDINIPLSMHIPAVCVGITLSECAHTLEEWLSISPIKDGLAQILRLSIEGCALIAGGMKATGDKLEVE